MKTLAFVFGLCIAAVGVVGMVEPSVMVWLAGRFVISGAFYAIAAVRVVFGLILIFVAPASRAPRGLRVLGLAIVILGILAALAGFAALGEARSSIDWWLHQGPGVARLTCVFVMALGGFVAYACAPAGRHPTG